MKPIGRTGTAPSLGLLAVALASASAAAQTAPDDEVRRQAVALFEQGLAAFQAADFPSAREAFQQSLELRFNATVLYNLATTQRALHDYPAAVASFRRYLETQGDRVAAAERTEIEASLADMEAKVAQVVVEAPDGAAIALDGRELGRAPLAAAVLLTPGTHAFVATLDGCDPASRELSPAAGERLVVRLDPPPRPAPPPPPEPVPPEPVPPEPVAGAGTVPDGPVDEPPLADDAWGSVPLGLGLGLGMNLRAVDFADRPFAENFYWTAGVEWRALDWLGVALDLVLPSVDVALWARFSFFRNGWLRLGAAPGVVVSSGAWSDRGAGFAVAAAVLAEFRLWEGLVLSLSPSVGLDVTRTVFVAPLTLGVAYWL